MRRSVGHPFDGSVQPDDERERMRRRETGRGGATNLECQPCERNIGRSQVETQPGPKDSGRSSRIKMHRKVIHHGAAVSH